MFNDDFEVTYQILESFVMVFRELTCQMSNWLQPVVLVLESVDRDEFCVHVYTEKIEEKYYEQIFDKLDNY